MDIDLTQKFKEVMKVRPRIRGRYNSSELFNINHGFRGVKTTPEQWLHSPERTVKDMLTMWNGTGAHRQIQGILGGKDYKEEEREFVYKDLILVAHADFLPPHKPDEVWELKTSEKPIGTMKDYHAHQVKLYCTMFDKQKGLVFQPVVNNDGVYLKHLGSVERDDQWFESEMEKLYQFHLEVEKLWENETN